MNMNNMLTFMNDVSYIEWLIMIDISYIEFMYIYIFFNFNNKSLE